MALENFALNGGQVLIQQTDDTAYILASSVPKMGTGLITMISYADHKYSVGQTVAYLVGEASFFKDVENNVSYAVLEEKYIFFSYEIVIPP